MRSALCLLALSLAFVAPAATAAEVEPTEAAPVPAVAVEAGPDEADVPRMHLEEIRVEPRTSDAAAAEATQWPARGSFWWMVGVIVVAGVILAVLLD